MPSVVTGLIALTASVLIGANLFGLRLLWRFLDRLKTQHESEWASLGRPGIANPEGSPAANALFWFIAAGRFYRLQDDTLSSYGTGMQRLLWLSIACMLVLFILLRSV